MRGIIQRPASRRRAFITDVRWGRGGARVDRRALLSSDASRFRADPAEVRKKSGGALRDSKTRGYSFLNWQRETLYIALCITEMLNVANMKPRTNTDLFRGATNNNSLSPGTKSSSTNVSPLDISRRCERDAMRTISRASLRSECRFRREESKEIRRSRRRTTARRAKWARKRPFGTRDR